MASRITNHHHTKEGIPDVPDVLDILDVSHASKGVQLKHTFTMIIAGPTSCGKKQP
jgi:hypothetical protein